MSKHDAVFILKLTDDMSHEYRVTYILNIQEFKPTFANLKSVFKKAYVTKSLGQAIKIAKNIDKEKKSRYGQLILNKYKEFEWPDIIVGAARESKIIQKKRFSP